MQIVAGSKDSDANAVMALVGLQQSIADNGQQASGRATIFAWLMLGFGYVAVLVGRLYCSRAYLTCFISSTSLPVLPVSSG
jgi:hypothetical protein